ncbi:MAG: MoaD/ThiS family protein [Candidatus Omnitrophota bacterium]|nr:MAG: MoaD/ThiS family protein [Candidatus Omnitrophota bacterium]
MAKVKLPISLQRFTEGMGELQIDAATIAELLKKMIQNYPQLKGKLVDEKGNTGEFIRLYVNEEDIELLGGKSTFLGDQDTVSIITPLAGG